VLDKAVKHSIMNRNTAIRRKRRAANRMRALAS
jgi:ribosomal protein S20